MDSKEKLLKKYDGPNQETQRAIIEHLWRYPDTEHKPEDVFRAIEGRSRAGKVSTVRNRLSDLAKESSIRHERRSFYQWAGQGRRRPNTRLQEVSKSIQRWLETLDISYGVLLVTFMIWLGGLLSGIASLIVLFVTGGTLFGYTFFQWFIAAGTLTILGSFVVMVWVPLYLLDVKRIE